MKSGVFTWGKLAQFWIVRHLETPGSEDGVGFDLLLVTWPIQSRELPDTRGEAGVAQIGPTGAGCCS